ncbi:glycosylphosphatidylinositol anchor attachment 1 protein-like [Ostrea edulis]|uniref:glycosylphosphatidylinositol anchor attachment 1 protein-like n=1 Tax=Ostrea edulis TaxID=37623 RepID=UPI00209596CC|nr:glycosylphosphatidylinositol anchor attachment 1 protein-like [Ostrea edulis]XP_048779641.1 glycosylphosphatidylinositol anchor attachment 1 protein-like [Ostrea edulis]
MGLLTDPKRQKKIVDVISKYNNILCVLCYLCGVVGFMALAYQPFNGATYFSENALLPGLVTNEFYAEINMNALAAELKQEFNKDKRKVPREWIYNHFREIGLDTYIQNYSIKYPLDIAKGQNIPGQNVYGILRAKRSASTEAVVMLTPLRPKDSDLASTTGGIVLMMAMAQYFRRQTYWSKDIIFLVSDHEQIGLQAWLDGYHDIKSEYIVPSDVMGRSGAIQAAINLEIPDGNIRYFDVKIEGMNGQLPNLDLFNLVIRICNQERVDVTLHRNNDPMDPQSLEGYLQSVQTMLEMMWSHAAGTPSGNHGLFHKYHIEAVTLQGIRRKHSNYAFPLERTGRILEGIFRSLNNLLERFHQSFFFYILPGTRNYISIGMYMPPFGLICAAGLIKAIAIWVTLKKDVEDSEEKEKKSEEEEEKGEETEKGDKEAEALEKEVEELRKAVLEEEGEEEASSEGLISIMPVILISVMMGVFSYTGPDLITMSAPPFRIKMEDNISFGLMALYTASLMVPRLISRKQPGASKKLIFDWRLLKCVTLLFQSLVLFSISLMNISLAFFLAVVLIPITVVVQPTKRRLVLWAQKGILLLVSPAVLLFIASVITSYGGKNKDFLDLLGNAWSFMKTNMFLTIIDKYFFGSWMFSLFSFLMLPNWLMFWCIVHCHID